MAFQTQRRGNLVYLTAEALAGATHCFSTRLGGVSQGVYASMNLGVHRGDDPAAVRENYATLGAAVGFDPEDLVFTKQRHTDSVRCVTQEDRGLGLHRPTTEVCDGILTDREDVALCCFSADCTPILLYDPVQGVVGAVHSGWRGTAMGIARKAVEDMASVYGCRPENIRAAIGPCISRCCFEVGPEVPEAMRRVLGSDAEQAIAAEYEKPHVDLKMLNRLWLSRAGVERIDISPDCTMCRPDIFWSHRATFGVRGSLAAIIQLRK